MVYQELVLVPGRVMETMRSHRILGMVFLSLKDLLIWDMAEEKDPRNDFKVSFNFLVSVFCFSLKKIIIIVISLSLSDMV